MATEAPFHRVRSEPQFSRSARRGSVDTGVGSRVSSGASSAFSGSPPSGSVCSLATPSRTLTEKIQVRSLSLSPVLSNRSLARNIVCVIDSSYVATLLGVCC